MKMLWYLYWICNKSQTTSNALQLLTFFIGYVYKFEYYSSDNIGYTAHCWSDTVLYGVCTQTEKKPV